MNVQVPFSGPLIPELGSRPSLSGSAPGLKLQPYAKPSVKSPCYPEGIIDEKELFAIDPYAMKDALLMPEFFSGKYLKMLK